MHSLELTISICNEILEMLLREIKRIVPEEHVENIKRSAEEVLRLNCEEDSNRRSDVCLNFISNVSEAISNDIMRIHKKSGSITPHREFFFAYWQCSGKFNEDEKKLLLLHIAFAFNGFYRTDVRRRAA